MPKTISILFVWTGVTSYMADCWRELRSREGVSLGIVIESAAIGREFDAAKVLAGLDVTVVSDASALPDLGGFVPDILFAGGWHSRVVRGYVRRFAESRKILVFDMPWRRSLRCFAARFVLGGYIRKFEAAFVNGSSAARYAKWLGFARKRIYTGVCSIDTGRFSGKRTGDGFLFIGRDAPEKGIDVLRAAYEMYRARGGKRELCIPGWVAPEKVPEMMLSHETLIVPSRWEPWGVVVAEAKAAGMKVIVSDAVGARFDIQCDGVFASGDASALADEMLRVEQSPHPVAADIGFLDCRAWADRVLEIWRVGAE